MFQPQSSHSRIQLGPYSEAILLPTCRDRGCSRIYVALPFLEWEHRRALHLRHQLKRKSAPFSVSMRVRQPLRT
ncbi:hypothetical protein A0H81_01355 [Grifola frondosa]|uniref:Uncharacterized protein n=1 Tax=Grifola frondosa TaxID=5627 RepID=A0A1C7MQ81_GRIFR|nr:hypothetical protein A0H81_01355 [Grifola frondosa]